MRCLLSGRPARPAWWFQCFVLLAVLAITSLRDGRVDAAGREFQVRGHDFMLAIDTRWAGCGQGGYYPIRIRISNLGPTRNLTLRFQRSGGEDGSLTVSRTIRSESNSTQQVTLSIPVIGMQSHGMFTVASDGVRLDSFTHSFGVSDYANSSQARPSLLVVSPSNEDASGFDQGAYSLAMMSGGTSYSPYSGYARTEDHQVIPPTSLPDKWLDYSGLDYVAIPLTTLESLSASARDPLLDWVMSGGNLIVYDVASARAELDKIIGRGQRTLLLSWQPRRAERRPLAVTPVAPGMPVPAGGKPSAPPVSGAGWTDAEGAIQSAGMGLGRIHAMEFNPFGTTGESWAWFLQTEPEINRLFVKRFGTSPRERSQDDFYKFMIPGVGAAPVFMFLSLITLFSVVIGPVNLWILSRRKQLYLVLVTVPLMSLLTCLCLFVYAFLADGLSTRARLRSITVVDSGAARAVTLSRIMLYAGLSPSGGLEFSDQTAVLPVWSEAGSSGDRAVDWTNTQSLRSGWLPSRTFTQMVTATVEPQRGRLEVRAQGEQLAVNNGFAVGLTHLFVTNDVGHVFYGDALSAGAAGTLSPAPEGAIDAFDRKWLSSVPAMPVGMDQPSQSRSIWGGFQWTPNNSTAHFEQSLMEQELGRGYLYKQQNTTDGRAVTRPARWYWAITESNPGASPGTDSAVVDDGFHVITGRY